MTMIGALHKLSRSVGCALLVASDGGKTLVAAFIGGELLLFFAYKIARNDFFYWVEISGVLSLLFSTLERTIYKVIADFTGCLHYRHSFEMGGLGFTLSMVWSQVRRRKTEKKRGAKRRVLLKRLVA